MGLKPDEKLLLMVARMDRIKSHDVAIRALSLSEKHGKVSFGSYWKRKFLFVKEGRSGPREGRKMEGAVGGPRQGVETRRKCFILGFVSFDGAEAAYSLASAVLLTSGSEGFGISVLEGWTSKKPVVVSKGAGIFGVGRTTAQTVIRLFRETR